MDLQHLRPLVEQRLLLIISVDLFRSQPKICEGRSPRRSLRALIAWLRLLLILLLRVLR
jgi:hypothetical protein